MKRIFVVVLLALFVIVGCAVEPTPTVSPIITPPVSPLETPKSENRVLEQRAEIEKIETVEGTKMDAELLAGILAIAMSLAFSYIPGLRDLFEPLEGKWKQAIMGIGLIIVAGASFGLACGGIADIGLACDRSGALGLLDILIKALIANQSVYFITKPSGKAK